MKKTFLSIGTNLGNRELNIKNAIIFLQEEVGKFVATSATYETEPWGFEAENNFYNLVVLFETDLLPRELLNAVKRIEQKMGRVKTRQGYQSRIIDIDIIFYENQFYHDKNLSIPHKHTHMRNFVLMPLADLAPNYVHPLLQLSVSQMLQNCDDQTSIKLVGKTQALQ